MVDITDSKNKIKFEEDLNWANKASERLLNIGHRYAEIESPNRDFKEALGWYKLSAKAGNAEAMYEVSEMYALGWGFDRNPEKTDEGNRNDNYKESLKWILKSIESGSSRAMNAYATMNRVGSRGVKQNTDLAYKFFYQAANLGHIGAIREIAKMYYDGYVVEQDYELSLHWHKKASEAGDTSAMIHIGNMYKHGLGAEQDYVEASKWYKKASEAGSIKAMIILAELYDKEEDKLKPPPNESFGGYVNESFSWYEKAAEAGDMSALHSMAYMYAQCKVSKETNEKAVYWITKLAEAGDVSAKYHLIYMYKSGVRVVKNDFKVFYWMKNVVDGGNTKFINSLAQMYLDGRGCEKNEFEAFKLINKLEGKNPEYLYLDNIYRDEKGTHQTLITKKNYADTLIKNHDATYKI